MCLSQQGTLSEAKSHTRVTASLATVREEAADARGAPLQMIPFLRLSAIRDCARLSSQGALNWERRTGGGKWPASPCPVRKSPTEFRGSRRDALQKPGNHIRVCTTHSNRSLGMAEPNTPFRP